MIERHLIADISSCIFAPRDVEQLRFVSSLLALPVWGMSQGEQPSSFIIPALTQSPSDLVPGEQ